MADDAGAAVKRQWIKLDRYALLDLARDHDLRAATSWTLAVLLCQADYKTRAVAITITELAAIIGESRRTISAAIDDLVSAGLIEITRPFGPNRGGRVVIVAWDDLIVGTSGRGAATKRHDDDEGTEHPPRTHRAPAEQISANDQPERQNVRERGSEGVSTSSARGTGEAPADEEQKARVRRSVRCSRCRGEIDPDPGRPFTDPDPCRCSPPMPVPSVSWERAHA